MSEECEDVENKEDWKLTVATRLGLPHPSLFPIKSITFNATTPESHEGAGSEIQIGEGTEVPLAKFLQYGTKQQPGLAQV